VELISAVLGTWTEAARDGETEQLLEYGFSKYRKRVPVRAGWALAEPSIRWAGGELPLRAAGTVAVGVRRGQRLTVRVKAPAEVEGPIRRGARLGRAVVLLDGLRAASVPLRAGRALPEASALERLRSFIVDNALWLALALSAILIAAVLPEALQAMILTVTLNAAIDRTVAVPNFRLGPAPPGGREPHRRRRQGDQRRPRAAPARPPGDRRRLRRRADRQPVLEQLREEAMLTDFTWIAGETRINLAVIDPTSGEQTEINERGPAVSPEEVERFVERLATSPRARRSASSPAPCRRAPATTSTRAWSRTCASAASGRSSTPRGRRCWPGCAPAPRSSPRTSARPRSWSGRSSPTATTSSTGSPSWSAWAGEGRDHAAGRLRRGGRPGASGAGSSSHQAPRTVSTSARATPSSPATRRPLRRPRAGDCLAYGVACGAESTQHFGAGTVDRRQGRALLGRGRGARSGGPRGSVGWLFNATPPWRTIWRSTSVEARREARLRIR
jgi:1-phosphofructokinase/tagatose 6-phosphate kinase